MTKSAAVLITAAVVSAQGLRQDPGNPHYLEFRGKTTVLIGSTEHYGAVLNSAFDYRKYLDTIAADGLSLTRTFMGLYREVPGTFNIARNTLAPDPDKFLTPYAILNGKYDRTKWNEAFFQRLHDFVSEAGKRGIVVEIVLFCTFYEDQLWKLSPLNDGSGVPRTEVFTLKHPDLVAVEEAFVRKIIAELRHYDNIYYEICNEPYFAGVSLDWQKHMRPPSPKRRPDFRGSTLSPRTSPTTPLPLAGRMRTSRSSISITPARRSPWA